MPISNEEIRRLSSKAEAQRKTGGDFGVAHVLVEANRNNRWPGGLTARIADNLGVYESYSSQQENWQHVS